MEGEEEMKGSIVAVSGSRGTTWRIYVSAGKDGAGRRIRITIPRPAKLRLAGARRGRLSLPSVPRPKRPCACRQADLRAGDAGGVGTLSPSPV